MSEPARKDLATVRETPVAQTEAATIISVIERAALNPDVDVEKMERLFAMAEKAHARQAEHAYDDAMNAAQEEMRRVAADAHNPSTKSQFASYAALDRALRPIYAKHGFSLSFYQGEGAPADHIRVVCRVARAGHTERPHLDMPADGKGAKGGDVMTKTHATGAAITYGKRYLLGMIFNIAVGQDNDGNTPPNPRDMGGAAKRAIEDINACDTAADLALWKKNKSAGVANVVTAGEMKEIVSTYNRRVEAMKTRSADDDA